MKESYPNNQDWFVYAGIHGVEKTKPTKICNRCMFYGSKWVGSNLERLCELGFFDGNGGKAVFFNERTLEISETCPKEYGGWSKDSHGWKPATKRPHVCIDEYGE